VALPPNYAFVAGDNGSHTFTNGFTLVTVGTQTVTATDTVTGSITGQASVNVTPDVATHFSVSAPSAATAGQSFSVIVTALDANNHTVTGYAGTVHFTSSDGQAALPGDATLTNGTGTFTATLKTAGSQTVTAADTANGAITGQANVTVSAAAASTLVLGAPASATADAPFTVTVTAKDAFGNTATGYRGTVGFTSSDTAPGVVLPQSYTFTSTDNGAHTFTSGVTLMTAGAQTITATDTLTGSITGQATLTVTPAVATHLGVSAPASATAGSAFTVTVTALDANNHTVTGYAGTVHFTTTDGRAGVALPSDYTFVSSDHGMHTFTGGVTLVTAGAQTITATDTLTGSVTGQAGVTVSAAAASKLTVSAPSSTLQGAPFTVTVTAKDAFGNTATGYRGTVHFTSSDTAPGVALPPNYAFVAGDNGSHTFTNGFTLVTVGTKAVTATDTVTGSITGQASVTVTQRQSGNLIVNPGFETGNFSGWSINAAPDSSYFGVIGSNPHSGHYGAYFGSYYFERDDIYQNVPTIPGHTYRISYWVANDGGGDTEIRSSWGGTVLEDRFPNNTFPYQQHTFTRVATSTSTEFRIGGYQIPAIWYLDDVSVTDTTAAGAFRGGTGPNIATGNGRTATFSGSGPQAVLPGDATRAGQGSAGAPAHGGGPAAGADHAALDAVMAGLAQGGLNFGQPVAFGQPFEGPQAPDPGLLNALFGGAAFTLPGDGGTGLTGADGMSQPGPGHRPRPSGG
jgi:hypothetical protein